jgi:hypothetical protein
VKIPYASTQDHALLVYFFAALATASYEQLGWDSSVERVLIRDASIDQFQIQYRFRVGDKRYQTVKCLADFRANDIVGRATRVWEVTEIRQHADREWKPVGPPCVLKDIWMDAKERQEAITIKLIRHLLKQWMLKYPHAPDAADLETESDEDYPFLDEWLQDADGHPDFDNDAPPDAPPANGKDAPYYDYFPTVLSHGFVKLENGEDDSLVRLVAPEFLQTLRSGQFETWAVPDFVEKACRAPMTSLNSASTLSITSGLPSVNVAVSVKKVRARVRDTIHYREVLKHVGKTLFDAESVNRLCEGLLDAAIGKRPPYPPQADDAH